MAEDPSIGDWVFPKASPAVSPLGDDAGASPAPVPGAPVAPPDFGAPVAPAAASGEGAKGSGGPYTHEQWTTWYSAQQQQTQQPYDPILGLQSQMQQMLVQQQQMLQYMQTQQQFAMSQGQPSQPQPAAAKLDKKSLRQLSAPTLPDPSEGWNIYERVVQEFVAEVEDYATKYQIVRAVKDALPITLQQLLADRMTVKEMQADDALSKVMDWLESRYKNAAGEVELKDIKEFDVFRRKTHDMQAYIDGFEALLCKLSNQGHIMCEAQKTRYLFSKADLPPELEADVLLALNRVRKARNEAHFTYADLREELILVGKKPSAFVRVRTTTTTTTPTEPYNPYGGAAQFDMSNPYAPQRPKQPKEDRGALAAAAVRALMYDTERNEVRRNPLCWHFTQGTCNRGSQCRFSHAGTGVRPQSRSRSTRPGGKGDRKGKGRDARSRSRSTRPSFPRSSRSRSPTSFPASRYSSSPARQQHLCRQFQQGHCSYGGRCRFRHGSQPRSPTPRRFPGLRSPSSPRSSSPRFGTPPRDRGFRSPPR